MLPKDTTWMLWGTIVKWFGFVIGSRFCSITWRRYCFCFSWLLRTALNDCIQTTPHFAASFTALSCWIFERAVLYESQVSQDLGSSVRNLCGMCSTTKIFVVFVVTSSKLFIYHKLHGRLYQAVLSSTPSFSSAVTIAVFISVEKSW